MADENAHRFRKDDGICEVREQYLSADNPCDRFPSVRRDRQLKADRRDMQAFPPADRLSVTTTTAGYPCIDAFNLLNVGGLPTELAEQTAMLRLQETPPGVLPMNAPWRAT